MYIKNRDELESHGERALRTAALDIAEYALERVDPYRATRDLVRLRGDHLHVGDLEYDLGRRGDVFVLGAGKASLSIALALEDILGTRIRHSLVVVKEGQRSTTRIVQVTEAAHPLPDERGFRAAGQTLEMARQAGRNDIVFCAVTGGSSALWPQPVEGVTFEQKREVHRLLLESGASIREINAVRKHLSRIKGGRLALAAFPAEVINLTVSDVTGDPYDYITCPTVPDTSTFADALAVVDRYRLWDPMPPAVIDYLKAGTERNENPRDFGDNRCHTFLLVRSAEICEAAAEKAAIMGFRVKVLTCKMQGDSALEGGRFGRTLSDARSSCPEGGIALVAGGETTVVLEGPYGEGGPNQEFACAASLVLTEGHQVALSMDTDGTDGPTQLAGALVDASTTSRAREAGLDISGAISRHDVSPLLRRLSDGIMTGHTGTNVNDLKLGLCRITSPG